MHLLVTKKKTKNKEIVLMYLLIYSKKKVESKQIVGEIRCTVIRHNIAFWH